MKHLKYNLEILKDLTKIAKAYPDWRFHQMLCNVGMRPDNDPFYEESRSTLNKLGVSDANGKNRRVRQFHLQTLRA
jgi:hypothetical protein